MPYAASLQGENSQSATTGSLAAIQGGIGFASASQTVATPGVFTTVTQAFTAGQPVYLTGIAPGGFALNTVYYVIAAGLTTTSCQLAATIGGTGIQCTASAVCVVNPTFTHVAGDTVIVICAQNPGSIATLTDTLGNSWTLAGHAGIASFGKFLWYCQNSLAGANIITGHTNGSDFSAISVTEISGLATSGGPLGTPGFNAQNGPGSGTDIVTSTGIVIGAVPAMLYGFGTDDTGSFVPTAGTLNGGFTGRGSIWGNLTGGVRAITEDQRITSIGTYAATFGNIGKGGDVYLACGIAFAELGAQSPGLPVASIGVVNTVG